MKLQAFSIFDHASETFAGPFFVPSERVALRVYSEIANNPQSDVSKYPKDYELFHIGTFDTTTALLTDEKPTMIARASSLVKKIEAENKIAENIGGHRPEGFSNAATLNAEVAK